MKPEGTNVTAQLRAMASRLRAAIDFESAAIIILDTLRTLLDAGALEGARVVGGMLHLRSDDGGYRALVKAPFSIVEGPVAPSATVWSCVAARGAVVVDLGTQQGVTLPAREPVELVAPYVAHDGSASVQQMIERETSHIVALPLRSGGAVFGMASIELAWPSRIGEPLPDAPFWADLELVTELAAPTLCSLPLPSHARPSDPIFPVAGTATQHLFDVLSVFVDQDETILITGPTGAGKSRLAEWCHARSRRARAPFETANLLAVPETMQMAELFGWKKGAFTGAQDAHDGLVASADGGTLFLDEIDKLSLGAQAGLLRLLETRRFTPLGASRERSVDVRFIVATNADLRQLVRRGAFREDLYYRINVLPVHLPALSARLDEIGPWASTMLARRHADAGGRGPVAFTDGALARLRAQPWPGNLRQLDNVVRRLYALALSRRAGRPSGALFAIDADLVEQALALEGGPTESDASAAERLREVAASLVSLAIELRRGDGALTLDEIDVLRGAALRSAAERLGSVKDAFLLFGADALVRGRNHTAAYKRHLAALEALENKLARRS